MAASGKARRIGGSAAVSVLLAVALNGVVAGGSAVRPIYVPDPDAADGVMLDAGVWVIERRLYEARLFPIDDESRRQFLREYAGTDIDPFQARRPEAPAFLTFVLDLKVFGEGMLILQPQRCRLITNKLEFRYPLDMQAIETAYALMEGEMPEAYRKVAPALLDGERRLQPGQRLRGLLVYEGVDVKTKTFTLEVQMTSEAGEVEMFTAAYAREKKKKQKS